MSDAPAIDLIACRTPDALASVLAQWRDFVARTDVDCGFWCDPFVFSEMAGIAQGDMLVLAIVCRDGDRVAMLPFTERGGAVPLFVGLLRLGAVRANLLRLNDYEFALRLGNERFDILGGVLNVLRGQKAADVVLADNCAMDGGKLPAAWSRGSAVLRNLQPTYVVDMPYDFDAYLASLSSNTRQMLRRRVRKMQKECGDTLRTKCFCAEGEMGELLEHLSAIWKRSWHGKLNRQPPPELSFLKSMARQGWVRSYILFVGEAPAASVLGFQYKGTFLDEAPAYDDRWKRFSPGLVLNYFIMQNLFRSDPPRIVDFGFGYNQYKEMLGTRTEWRGQLWMPITPRGHVLVAVLRACDGLYGFGKRVLGRTGMVRRIKARVQGRGR